MKEIKTLMKVKTYLTGSKRQRFFGDHVGILLTAFHSVLFFCTQALAAGHLYNLSSYPASGYSPITNDAGG